MGNKYVRSVVWASPTLRKAIRWLNVLDARPAPPSTPLKPANDDIAQQLYRLLEVISNRRFKEEFIMLQTSEIQKRFSHLQQTISEASRTCHSDKTVPKDLMDYMDELDKECQSRAKSVMASQDDDRIRQWVDDLERIGDRAERACNQAGSLNTQIKSAVSTMHSELSDLKRQLH